MAETVGEMLGDRLTPARPWEPFTAPTLPDYEPQFPAPGIYFDMPDEVYHAIPALSQSGIKKLAASPMLFWAGCVWMNAAKRARQERAHFTNGKAYHCRLLEGAAAFAERFVTSPDKSQFEGLLESTAQIKHAITQVVLHDAGGNPLTIKPVTTVEEDDGKGGVLKRPAKKEDWTKQLLELNPEAPIWEAIEARYLKEHEGKTFIHADMMAEIELAARMIELDPGVAPLVRGGMSEVSLFWYCPVTGVPMKMRVDKMKVRRMVDLKTLVNQRERSIENAIRFEISGYKYNLQPSVYFEGAAQVRKIVRKLGAQAIRVWGEDTDEPDEAMARRVAECRAFAEKWASHVEPDEWTWIFQQKGDAPITRAVHYLRGGTVNMVTDDIVSLAKKRFREFAEGFGTDPWLDIAPPYTLADEDIPTSATEI
ncbi:PD-(D/E)XK nuclease-like domain-containing protein [Sphingobium yanoikuyae]|uniref:PD-(D/E)XK nuclease-like domain-containing protein n=1 Tax=Sphingobium yanoikuyae TaxID=13690 RepID=UPI0035C6B93D